MDSKTIVDRYEAKLEGQQMLWIDYDIILRNTPFKSIEPEFDKQALIHWWMNVYMPEGHGDEKTPYEVYTTWSHANWEYFKYAAPDGYNPNTKQTAINVHLYKKTPLEPQLAEIRHWLEYVKPFEGVKHFSIMEESLSAGGCYSVNVSLDKVIIIKRTYGRDSIIKEFVSLRDAVDYIRNKLWYKKNELD